MVAGEDAYAIARLRGQECPRHTALCLALLGWADEGVRPYAFLCVRWVRLGTYLSHAPK